MSKKIDRLLHHLKIRAEVFGEAKLLPGESKLLLDHIRELEDSLFFIQDHCSVTWAGVEINPIGSGEQKLRQFVAERVATR
jgi:hypothetical protein